MKKLSTNKLLSLLIVFALLLGLFPPVMLSVDAATIYRWDHIINADSAYPYHDDINSLYIWAFDESYSNRTLSSDSGWLKISGGTNNRLQIEKTDTSNFNNENFSVKIKSVSGTESVTVRFLDDGYSEISSQTVTATQEGVVASLPATSNVTYVSFESAGEFSITDMTFGNTAPVFTSSSLSTHIGMDTTSFNIASYLGVNDSDSDQTLTWFQNSAPSHGTLEITDATASSGGTSITPGGTIKYRPDGIYYGGTDSFSIAVTDGISTDIKTFNIYINYKPEFIDNNNLTLDTNSSAIDIKGYFLVDDLDIGQTLNWTIFSSPSHGSLNLSGTTASSGALAISPGGNMTYQPYDDYIGTDSFTIMIFDGKVCVLKELNLTVNTNPVFIGSSDLYVAVDSSVVHIKDLLHVSDTDSTQTLTWTQSSAPSHGTLVISSATASAGSTDVTPGGTITYQPAAGYTGTDSFDVSVSDGITTVTKTINVTVVKKPIITTMGNDNGISGDYITSATDITFSGTATANSTIEMFKDGVSIGTTTTSSIGNWSYGVNPITEGTYSFMYSSILGGVTVFAESERIVVIDTTAPSVPTITSINPDTGVLSTDRITSTNTFTVHGTADANSYVEVFDSDTFNSHGSAITDSEGNWSREITTPFTTSGGLTVKARDIAGNDSAASSSYTVIVDTNAPTFTLSPTPPSTTNQSPIPISVVFTEAVTGFNSDDITVTNATKENFTSSDNITYTLDLVPTAQGDITVSIPANAAYDLAGNGNSNSSAITVKYDNIAPTVEITSTTSMDTNIYDIPVKIMFSEDVTGFTVDDLVMSNATPKAGSFEVVSAREYNVIAVATALGLVTVDVAANMANDAAGNGNTAATQLSRRFDRVRPTVSVTSPSTTAITDVSVIPVVITFSESVTGFSLADIAVTNGSADNLSGSGSTYYADITPAMEGYVYVSISELAAQDAATNQSRATTSALQRIYDVNPPSVNISSSSNSTTNTAPIPVTITFSEAVTGFVFDDISVSNGSLSNFIPVNGYTYTVDLTPSGQGQITVDVAADVAIDAAGNFNTAAAQLEVVYDTESPSVNISSSGSATNISPIPVTFTFSEAVIGFTSSDIAVTNGTLSNLNTVNNIVFTADITPSAQGNVRINISSARATDVAGNNNTAASEFTIKYDTSRPSASIYSTAPAYVTSAFNVNIQFSEEVTGFDLTDISVTNGTPSGLTTADNINYTVIITPVDQGTVAVNIATNAVFDVAGNGNSLVMEMTRIYDSVNPTVTIYSSLSSYTNISPIPLTITFSETVTGFTADDITVTNGTKGALSGSGSTYTIDITPFAQGTVRVNILSAVATDLAGNSNTAASEFVIGYDTVAPVTTIDTMQLNMDTNDSTDFITKYSDQTLYIVLTHRLSLTELVEISMDNGVTWTNFGHAANSYSSNNNITLLDGTHNIKLRIVDLAGNIGPVTTQQYTLDTDRPTVQVTSTVTEPTNQSPIPITITFSEDVIGMQLSDLRIENGTASSLLGSGNIYTAQITPSGNGVVRLRLEYGSVMDAAANAIETSSYYTWIYDGTSPTVEITSTETTYTRTSPIPITITFSENVVGMELADITVTNGTAGSLSGSGNTCTALITPTTEGQVSVEIQSGKVTDNAGNANTASAQGIWIYDVTSPTPSISSTAPTVTNTSPIPITITVDEYFLSFTADDIEVSNGTITNFESILGDYYTAQITPTGQGDVTVDILSGTVTDRAGNLNNASNQLVVTYDTVAPTLTISSTVPTITNVSSIPITITFSENVVGMELADITVINGTAGSLSGSGNTYTALITPTTEGQVSVEIQNGKVTDNAGNANTASAQGIWIYDGTSPTVEITSTADSITNISSIPLTITFSEAVTGFTANDITVTNCTVSNLNTTDSITYTADITLLAQGTFSARISAGTAHDAAGNGNTASTTLTRKYDSINPTVVISSATSSSTNVTPIPVTITFSENVTGFTVNDITVTNGAAGGFVSVSESVYTALITPAGNGEVIVDVLADTASDLGGNSNNAALSLTRIFDSIRPTVIISSTVSDYTINSLVTLTFTFSKAVTDFAIGDIIVSNGNASNFASVSNSIYAVDVTSITQGNVTVDVPAAVAQDVIGNTNTAATQFAYIYDNQAPVIGAAEISVDVTDTDSISFSWDAATDNISSASNLLYRAYYSTRDNISNVSDVLSNGTAINDWSSDTDVTATGLSASTIYYINVIVKDETGNTSAYSKVTDITDDEEEIDEDIPLPNNTVITVDGQEQEAANIKRETTQGVTRITVTVDDFLVSNLMQSEEEGTVVTLPATGYTNEVVGQLNGQTVKNMEQKNAILEIKTDKASYSLPADQINIDEVSKALGSQTNLEDIKVKVTISEPDDNTVEVIADSVEKDKLQLVVKPVQFTITCETKEETVEVSKFKGYVERRIAIPDGVDPSLVTTAVVLNDDGTLTHVPTTIIKEGNKYYAVINSLTNSTYTVIYNNIEIKDAKGHWAQTELNDMASRLVIQADFEGKFNPDEKITRAQFSRFIVKALGLVPDSYENIFTDVSSELEDSVYIEKAYEYGIINGYGNGLFGPTDLLTREQATTMLERAMKLAGLDVDMKNEELDLILDKFTDKNKISSYAINSVALCVRNGIVIGRLNDDIDPGANLTRAEAVVMLRRMLQEADLINK